MGRSVPSVWTPERQMSTENEWETFKQSVVRVHQGQGLLLRFGVRLTDVTEERPTFECEI